MYFLSNNDIEIKFLLDLTFFSPGKDSISQLQLDIISN